MLSSGGRGCNTNVTYYCTNAVGITRIAARYGSRAALQQWVKSMEYNISPDLKRFLGAHDSLHAAVAERGLKMAAFAQGLPSLPQRPTVVYPFSGVDVTTPLQLFPDASHVVLLANLPLGTGSLSECMRREHCVRISTV